jgi:UDPglucose 6-dehydrogenase
LHRYLAERFETRLSASSGWRSSRTPDDLRELPAIPLITALQDLGAKIKAYDPEGMEQARAELSDVTYCDGPYSCAKGADALVIVTEWEQFRALDLARLKRAMATP